METFEEIEKNTEGEINVLSHILEALENENDSCFLEKNIHLLEKKWKSIIYPIEIVLDLIQLKDFIENAEKENLEFLIEYVNIIVTHKDRKKGRKGIYQRFLKNYHKSKIREQLHSLFKQLISREKGVFEEDFQEDCVHEFIKNTTFETVYWIALSLEDNKNLIKFLQSEYKPDYLKLMLNALIFFYEYNFENVMSTFDSNSDKEKFSTKKTFSENKNLKKKIIKEKSEKNKLQHMIYQLNKDKKILKRENYSQFEEMFNEIEKLRNDIIELEQEFSLERQFYNDYIIRLLNQNKFMDEKKTISTDLKGKTICLIGGFRKRHYEEIVNKYNGQLKFISADDFNKIKNSLSNSIAIFFLTEMIGHKHFKEALKQSKDLNIPFIFVNSLGTSSFENELIYFIKTQE